LDLLFAGDTGQRLYQNMLFNSLAFLYFFSGFYLVYLALHRWVKAQNLWLLAASYFFYGAWSWRFLLLIGLSTLTDYTVGRLLNKINHPGGRKALLGVSLAVNLSLLGIFKYFDFFSASLAKLLATLGVQTDPLMLQIALPLGISFYTLKTLSYTIDIYRRRLQPTASLLDYAIYVSFFPVLLAGPIDRAASLLPQIANRRPIASAQVAAGSYLILAGCFKKLVIADNLALITTRIFAPDTSFAGLDIILGVLAYAVQIYADFSGYSDMARGLGKSMGFELAINFKLPYLALSPADFWQRWHVSLSEWLRDYIFFPTRRALLRRSRASGSLANWLIPPLVTMGLSGLWHGAGWTFVLWGLYHGALLALNHQVEPRLPQPGALARLPAGLVAAARMIVTFALVTFGWLFFRAVSLDQVSYLLTHLSLAPSAESAALASSVWFFSLPLIVAHVFQQHSRDLLIIPKLATPIRVAVYGLILAWMLIFGVRQATEFIYFQF
jgi:D-alanyl-lipoteichoic acid acyltransferase DltB (MBOAT superfamily)